jgi:hypothetical protein
MCGKEIRLYLTSARPGRDNKPGYLLNSAEDDVLTRVFEVIRSTAADSAVFAGAPVGLAVAGQFVMPPCPNQSHQLGFQISPLQSNDVEPSN